MAGAAASVYPWYEGKPDLLQFCGDPPASETKFTFVFTKEVANCAHFLGHVS